MFFSIGVILKKQLSLWRHARLHGMTVYHSCMYIKLCRLEFSSNGFVCFLCCVWKLSIFRVTHNWWHVALCYLEANSPLSKILEIYDNYIWKELEKPDAIGPEVLLVLILLSLCSQYSIVLGLKFIISGILECPWFDVAVVCAW